MRRLNKKGSHVGFVVSFVIFITFLIFLYAILQPTITRDRGKNYILGFLSFNFINSSSSEVTTMTINVEEPVGPQSCINLQQIVDDDKIPEYMVDHLLFKTDEETFTYQKNLPNIRVNTGNGFQGILNVYYSEKITPLPYDGVSGCSPKNYPLGVIKTYTEVFESNIEELYDSYYAEYGELKLQLGIPEGTEFSFILYDAERNIIYEAKNEDPPETQSVYSEEIPIEYIDGEGQLKFGFLVITVW